MKKKIAAMLLSGAMLISGSAFAYNDMDNHWAKTYINNMKSAGVLNQFKGDKIYPEWKMTREECAVLISDFAEKYYNYKPPYIEGNYKFPDLIDGENADKIRALSMLTYRSVMTSEIDDLPTKIIRGYPIDDNFKIEFKPDNLVTRAEFAKMLMNTMDCMGYVGVGNSSPTKMEVDNHWGFKYMLLAHGYGIMEGYSSWYDGHYTHVVFRPDGDISRAEAIKMVASARNSRYFGPVDYNKGGTRPKGVRELYYLSE